MRLPCRALLAFAAIPGMALGMQLYVPTPGERVTAEANHFSVRPPPGWVCRKLLYEVLASRDGFGLNTIAVEIRKPGKAFPTLKKALPEDALPEELAETYVADLQARKDIHDVKLLTVEPATLAGVNGFRVHLTYRLPDELGGATMEAVAVAAVTKVGLLVASFDAPRLHYFAASLPAFEDTLTTIEVDSAEAAR